MFASYGGRHASSSFHIVTRHAVIYITGLLRICPSQLPTVTEGPEDLTTVASGSSETTHFGNAPLNTLLIRQHLRSAFLLVPHGTSKGLPLSAEASSNIEEQVGQSQKNSE